MLDHVPSNLPDSSRAILHVSDDREAVFRMIIEGRRLDWRHVSLTHRVDLDRLLGRIQLDNWMFIRSVRTHEPLVDLLTKCLFTTIQWKSLMRLFDIHSFATQLKCTAFYGT